MLYLGRGGGGWGGGKQMRYDGSHMCEKKNVVEGEEVIRNIYAIFCWDG